LDNDDSRIPTQKTLWMYLWEGFRQAHARRPMSFYLLLSIPIVLLLGINVLDVKAGPKAFGWSLILLVVFFFMVMVRAVIDFFEIARRHFTESQKLFANTLGDEEFLSNMKKNLIEKRRE